MHLHQLPSKRWRWIVQHNGQRLNGTADTRGKAALAASKAMIELGADRGETVAMNVRDLLDVWIAERLRDWSPTYAADMVTVCDRLPAAFHARDISTITPPVVAALHRQLVDQGWSGHRIRRAAVAVSQAFSLAVTYGWAHHNPARDVKPPKVEPADVHAPDPSIVRQLVSTAPDRLKLILRLAALTGARLGELVAIRWDDLDGDTLTIRRAVVYTPATGVQVRNQTKSGRKGDRRLDLDDVTVTALEELHTDQTEKAATRRLPAPVYVFSHDKGVTPWRPGYVGLAFRRHRDTIPGAGHVRFHDLRHHVATTMLADGDNPVAVAAQLGHSTPATTMRVYAHYLPGQGGESVRRRAAMLDD